MHRQSTQENEPMGKQGGNYKGRGKPRERTNMIAQGKPLIHTDKA